MLVTGQHYPSSSRRSRPLAAAAVHIHTEQRSVPQLFYSAIAAVPCALNILTLGVTPCRPPSSVHIPMHSKRCVISSRCDAPHLVPCWSLLPSCSHSRSNPTDISCCCKRDRTVRHQSNCRSIHRYILVPPKISKLSDLWTESESPLATRVRPTSRRH